MLSFYILADLYLFILSPSFSGSCKNLFIFLIDACIFNNWNLIYVYSHSDYIFKNEFMTEKNHFSKSKTKLHLPYNICPRMKHIQMISFYFRKRLFFCSNDNKNKLCKIAECVTKYWCEFESFTVLENVFVFGR